MDEVTRQPRPKSTSTAEQPASAGQPPVTPVKSAKDAINAMYASDPSTRLSQYLATSAKDIINSSSDSKPGSRSAASLHHSSTQRRLKSARPSASAIFRNSQSGGETPVIRTSLKLKPKKAAAPRPAPQKINVISSDFIAPSRSTPKSSVPISDQSQPLSRPAPTASPSPARPAGRRFMQDVIRPAKPQNTPPTTASAPKVASAPIAPSAPRSATHPTGRRQTISDFKVATPTTPASLAPSAVPAAAVDSSTTKKPKAKSRSLESIKKRFRPGSKAQAESASKNKKTKRTYRAEDFLHPNYSDAPITPAAPVDATPPKEPIHIYGMSPDPEQLSEPPIWSHSTESASADGVQLGVVEDHSTGTAESTSASATPNATPRSPEVLGGDSPFFLKSVSVEKRPLSDAPPRHNPQVERPTRVTPSATPNADSLAAAFSETTPDTSAKPKKIKSSKTPKPAKTPKPPKQPKQPRKPKSSKHSREDFDQPTVIIPQRNSSHTSLIVLLFITIIIGALVGAATYLFLFQ